MTAIVAVTTVINSRARKQEFWWAKFRICGSRHLYLEMANPAMAGSASAWRTFARHDNWNASAQAKAVKAAPSPSAAISTAIASSTSDHWCHWYLLGQVSQTLWNQTQWTRKTETSPSSSGDMSRCCRPIALRIPTAFWDMYGLYGYVGLDIPWHQARPAEIVNPWGGKILHGCAQWCGRLPQTPHEGAGWNCGSHRQSSENWLVGQKFQIGMHPVRFSIWFSIRFSIWFSIWFSMSLSSVALSRMVSNTMWLWRHEAWSTAAFCSQCLTGPCDL